MRYEMKGYTFYEWEEMPVIAFRRTFHGGLGIHSMAAWAYETTGHLHRPENRAEKVYVLQGGENVNLKRAPQELLAPRTQNRQRRNYNKKISHQLPVGSQVGLYSFPSKVPLLIQRLKYHHEWVGIKQVRGRHQHRGIGKFLGDPEWLSAATVL